MVKQWRFFLQFDAIFCVWFLWAPKNVQRMWFALRVVGSFNEEQCNATKFLCWSMWNFLFCSPSVVTFQFGHNFKISSWLINQFKRTKHLFSCFVHTSFHTIQPILTNFLYFLTTTAPSSFFSCLLRCFYSMLFRSACSMSLVCTHNFVGHCLPLDNWLHANSQIRHCILFEE